MKVAITADLHAGKMVESHRKKLDDVLSVLDDMNEKAKEHGADAMVVAGDLFDQKGTIRAEVYNAVWERIRDAEIPYYILAGNHGKSSRTVLGDDHPGDDTVYAMDDLEDVETVTGRRLFVDEKFGGEGSDVTAFFQPYVEDVEDLVERLSSAEVGGSGRNVLFGHFGIADAEMGPAQVQDRDWMDSGDAVFKDFDWVFAGHYHRPQNFGEKVWIPGSPLQHSFGEREQQKRMLFLDTEDGSVESVSVDGPRYVVVETKDDFKGLTEYDQPLYVRFDCPVSEDLKSKLRGSSRIRSVTSNVRKEEEVEARMDLSFDDEDDGEIVEEYVRYVNDNESRRVDSLAMDHDVSVEDLRSAGKEVVGS